MSTYTQTAACYDRQRENKLRALLRRDYGKFRITKADEVHAYGPMPNSTSVGWWFVGYKADVAHNYTL